jgi:hypothetical protein
MYHLGEVGDVVDKVSGRRTYRQGGENETHAPRKMSGMDDTAASLMHLFSFGVEATFRGVEGNI